MKKILIIGNVLLALVLLSVVAWQSIAERTAVVDRGFIQLDSVVAAMEEHAEQTLAAVDLSLTALAVQGLQQGLDSAAAHEVLARATQNRQLASSSTLAHYVLNGDAELVAGAGSLDLGREDFNQAPEFLLHASGATGNGLHLGQPRQFHSQDGAQVWGLPASWRIPDADNAFSGVAVAILSLEHFTRFYSSLSSGTPAVLGVLNSNLRIIIRSPLQPEFLNRALEDVSLYREVALNDVPNRVRDQSADGAPRLSAFRQIWGDQLYVYANINESVILSAWRERLNFKLSIVALVMVIFAAGSLLLVYFTRRQLLWHERTLAERERAVSQVQTIFNSISDAVLALDRQWRVTYLNAEAEQLLERESTDLIGKGIWNEFPEARGSEFERQYSITMNERRPVVFEQFYAPLNKLFSIRAFPHEEGISVYFQDITQQRAMEERLRHADKMDAVGQLTGGIAHDFNNLLTVILGNIDVLLEHLHDQPDDVRAQADVIRLAGERAAELTHRLLAFARKQPLDPKPTDLNALCMDVHKLLTRTVAENIHLELKGQPELWMAHIDASQLQNAVLNLCLNARDAMPDGGRLTMETANVVVDDQVAAQHDIRPGEYVVVAVSDTGCGMTPEQISKAFDPFYTTKEEGKGSGLGLAMVYGFARQSNGHVRIYSEAGQGTTVRLYLPRSLDNTQGSIGKQVPETGEQGGNERVLLVEDDALVRQFTLVCLQRLGYQVTACDKAETALTELAERGDFDLLFTDVVLTEGISGKQLADIVAERWPDTRVLFMSGYTENAIIHHGRLDPGVQLLSKPFRLADLASKVRETLDK